ncbi:MAG: sphingosine kinase, partial [Thermoleophilaceae bacterium]|nr:sphingosine kinase [Thermoleophilaceae bacterium]
MTPRLALLPNPAAGGGRAERILPEVLSELDALGVERRVVTAATLAEARIEAGRAAAA